MRNYYENTKIRASLNYEKESRRTQHESIVTAL